MRKFENYYEMVKELLSDSYSIFSTITGKYIFEGLAKEKAELLFELLNPNNNQGEMK
ncbi:hypothetical protein [Paenibacillus xylanexedens]|uniref:hypothetical protein n=1 Tax=Paenibacillus xylanexedens TaxID=528191 RepID=UPI0016433E94|nr:hypothetical protein [Paenibacillus xylanexedens]